MGVGAHATGEKAVAIGLDAHALGINAIAIGAGVTARENEVVIGSTQHTYKLPGLSASQTGNPEVLTVDETGELSPDGGDLYDRVSKLEAGSTVTTGAGGLGTRAAVAPAPVPGADSISRNTDSDENSNLGTPSDPADEDGSAFARIAKVREDVGATNARLGQVSGELSTVGRRMDAFDERVNALDERLDRATAMSSALSALPNTVPDGGKLFLGLGVGHFGDKQAIALGLSARLGVQGNIFVNAGLATSTGGDSVSARAGMGFVWK